MDTTQLINDIDAERHNFLAYFFGKNQKPGKAYEAARAMLDLVIADLRRGEWTPGVSRKVAAAFNKQAWARKLAEDYMGRWSMPSINMCHGSLMHCDVDYAVTNDLAKLTQDGQWIYATWCKTMLPVKRAIELLDSVRPKPVFTSLGVSPTMTKTLEMLGFSSNGPWTVGLCPGHFEEKEVVVGAGKKMVVPEYVLDWPEGTEHGRSRFSFFSHQCESCGHGIKVRGNWVPLVMRQGHQPPYSLMVGRDCAKSIFGIEVKGVLEIKE